MSNSYYTHQTVTWLESVMPQPSHVPEDMVEKFGANPLLHLCPLIAEYLGPNPYYCIPEPSCFQIKDKIKQVSGEKQQAFEVYDAFFYEMRETSTPMIPTPFPQFDRVLQSSIAANLGTLPPEQQLAQNPHQHYIFNLLRQHHKFFNRYLFRYLPGMTQNEITTQSITNITTLYDGSILLFNENNVFLWPSKYCPPALPKLPPPSTTSTTSTSDQDSNSTTPQDSTPSSTNTNQPYSVDTLLKYPQLAQIQGTTFEELISTLPPFENVPSIAPNKRQLETNTTITTYLLNHFQHTKNIFKKQRVKQLFPHLHASPFLLHTYDLAENNFNPDIMLDRLPHQLSKSKLASLKKKKRQFLQTLTERLSPSELSAKFAEAHDLTLFEHDLHFLDDLDFDDDEDFHSKAKDSNSSDDDSDEDSSSGDNDSEYSSSDDDSSGDDRKQSNKSKITCPFGHTLYSSVCPIPPQFHIKPEDDPFLRDYGISMHSTRLFVTGCNHGHIVLHDGLTGFNKLIGSSKFPIVQLSIVPIHQHYSEITPNDFNQILQTTSAFKTLQKERCDHVTPVIPSCLKTSTQQSTTTTSTSTTSTTTTSTYDIQPETLYHPNTRVFPLIVSLDQIGTVMFWDATSASPISIYTQTRQADDASNTPPQQILTQSNMYNLTGVLKMTMCAIPLLPHCQRQERFGQQTILPPLKTIYANPSSSVLSMVFNRYQQHGLDLKTGLPNPKSSPQLININPPQFDTATQPWCPFLHFPFHFASPKLNTGILVQFQDSTDAKSYIRPFIDPVTKKAVTDPNFNQIGALDLLTPNRGTFAAPTVIVTPYRKGQLTFCDLRNVRLPTFYTFAHKQHTTCIAYIGGLLWTAGWDCSIKSWDLRYLSTPVHTIQCSKKHITAMSGLDDKYLIIATAEKQIKIFDIEKLAINRTYAVHVVADCEEYIKSVDFTRYRALIDENDQKIARLQDKVIEYRDEQRKKLGAKQSTNDDIDEIDESPSNPPQLTMNDAEATNELPVSNLTDLYKILQIAPENRPKAVHELLQPDPFESSPYTMLAIYPNLIHTTIFHQWLQTHQLTYIANRFYPLMTSFDAESNCMITNMLTFGKNNNEPVPTARNATQRAEHSLNACLFDWDYDELVQNIITIDGVILTASKECKSKVGVNGLSGSVTPWVTSIDVSNSFGDIIY